ncbi:MAG: [protein-PII] uridylyltransferase, partial [Oceanococcaceae bacterium]
MLEQLGPDTDPLDPPRLRNALQWVRDQHYTAFQDQAEASELVAEYTQIVDDILRRVWTTTVRNAHCALLAVGGYGRGELLPHSDIDVLLLTPDTLDAETSTALENFIRTCWDCGLELGHSVRSLDVCAEEAAADITIVTNLMEARPLCGDSALADALARRVAPDQCWPARAFFEAKRDEQRNRYARFDDTAYKLEPNVKEGPGGLRDLQTILWLTQRLHGTGRLEDLARNGLLSPTEISDLRNGRNQLWRVRFALHMLTGRREDRLLFDHQVRLAEMYGYADQSANLAVEQFMQLYYRTIKMLSVLNDIFVQLFEEQISDTPATEIPVDEDFILRGRYLCARDDDVFRRRPLNLLRVFAVWMHEETARDVSGLSAQTLRLVRRDRNLIDAAFRSNHDARALFIAQLRSDQGVTRTLRRMNRYGVLGRYLPAFGRIIGRMQYDLFHQLTVDEHTLFVVRNIRRLAMERFRHEYPDFSDIHDKLPRPELLILAGLFHDIAKGRGGDHSELGADDAVTFCREHGLSTADQQTVAWLVKNHLLMSLTAQREDVSDPDVINSFVAKVES